MFEFFFYIATDLPTEAKDSLDILLESIQVYSPEVGKQEEDPTKIYLVISAFFLPFLIAISYFAYKYFQNRKWTSGSFPNVPFSNEDLSMAYISLAVSMISCDKFGQMKKLHYLRSYVRKFYSIESAKFEDIVDRNFHYPMHPESVCHWLKNHSNKARNQHFVEFLITLTFMEQGLKQQEYDLLKFIGYHSGMDTGFVDEIIEQRKATQESFQQEKRTRPRHSQRKVHAEILGVEENASVEEIKKQYRQLAKKYHPDRFANESEEKKEQAHQRFIEIQEAYEYLLK